MFRCACLGVLGALLTLGCSATATHGGVQVVRAPAVGKMGDERLALRTAGAIGVLTTDVGRGMAFVIDPRGFVMTNRHVIEDANHIENLVLPALDPPREFTRVHIVYIDPLHDLALLQVDVDEPLPALPLATRAGGAATHSLAADDHVMLMSRAADEAVGLAAHPGSVGSIATYNPAVGPGPYVGLSQDVQRGQSGGPVVDRFGRAVGVVTWTWKDRGGGFAIPIGRVNDLLRTRPALDDDAALSERARSRVDELVAALTERDLERARRTLSPSYAREVRDRIVGHMFPEIDDAEVVVEFTHTLEKLDPEQGFEALAPLAAKMGSPEARRALRVDGRTSGPSIVTFFMEVGQAYLAARLYGEQDRDEALSTVASRMMSLDAARSFALADLLADFHGASLIVESVDVEPSLHGPRAVASIRVATDGENVRAGDRMTARLRLEWGDWYVAQVQTVGTVDALTRAELSPRLERAALER